MSLHVLWSLDRAGTLVPIRRSEPGDWLADASYSPDGHTVVTVHATNAMSGKPVDPIETIQDDGTAEELLVGHTPLKAMDVYNTPSFSFDGTTVVYTDAACNVDLVDVATRKARTVYSGETP